MHNDKRTQPTAESFVSTPRSYATTGFVAWEKDGEELWVLLHL